MSATSQYTTYSDLFTGLQNLVREQTGVTAVENIAKRFINVALQDLHIGFGEKFPWAERRATLTTQDNYTTGTVAITRGSTALTGTSTAWNTNNDFGVANARTSGKIRIGGSEEVYTISAVGSDTSITLNEKFIDATVTEATYEYFEDEYDLASDFLRPLDQSNFDQNKEIPLLGRNEFRRRYPRNGTPNKPRVATITDKDFSGDTTPVRRIQFHPPPNDYYLIPYHYVTSQLAVSSAGARQTSLSADADEPIVPLQYRHGIVFHALYHWYRDRRDDPRAQAAKAEYVDILARMTADHEIGRSRPMLTPRVTPYVAQAKRPYRRRGGRFTTGTAFDELRDTR
jgi:hypothetical protein